MRERDWQVDWKQAFLQQLKQRDVWCLFQHAELSCSTLGLRIQHSQNFRLCVCVSVREKEKDRNMDMCLTGSQSM